MCIVARAMRCANYVFYIFRVYFAVQVCLLIGHKKKQHQAINAENPHFQQLLYLCYCTRRCHFHCTIFDKIQNCIIMYLLVRILYSIYFKFNFEANNCFYYTISKRQNIALWKIGQLFVSWTVSRHIFSFKSCLSQSRFQHLYNCCFFFLIISPFFLFVQTSIVIPADSMFFVSLYHFLRNLISIGCSTNTCVMVNNP